ncbi:MAG: PorV/PorQ family protein, partial [Cytophagales bacterium]|nr:PorV/PorQ family protein [Cytophagales bacterium]
MKKFLLLALAPFLFAARNANAQFSGNYSFDFLDAGLNARVAASGGTNVSLRDQDVNFFQYNPALLNEKMHRIASINYIPYFADINATSVSYADKIKGIGSVGASLNYINYGKFKGYDAAGNVTSDFTGNAAFLTLSHARQSGNFTFGANVKIAGSGIANYGAFGMFVDLGGAFVHPKQDLVIGISIRNIGG